ncbi:MAG: ParB N-terminal domain-containing protein, partial [Bacillota bacterium]
YEIVSGHQRVRAVRLLGWEEVLCLVRDLPDDEALAQLIDANIRSRRPGPMEIARAIKRRWDAIGNRQGERTDLSPTCATKLQKSEGKTREIVGKEFGMAGWQAAKYRRLNDLIPELQSLVESGAVKPSAAQELAYLSPDTQRELVQAYGAHLGDLAVAEARALRDALEERDTRLAELEQERAELARKLEEAETAQGEEDDGDPALLALVQELQEKLKASEQECARLKAAFSPRRTEVILKQDPTDKLAIEQLRAKVRELKETLAQSENAAEVRALREAKYNLELRLTSIEKVGAARAFMDFTRVLVEPLLRHEKEVYERMARADLAAGQQNEVAGWADVLGRYADMFRRLAAKGRGEAAAG